MQGKLNNQDFPEITILMNLQNSEGRFKLKIPRNLKNAVLQTVKIDEEED